MFGKRIRPPKISFSASRAETYNRARNRNTMELSTCQHHNFSILELPVSAGALTVVGGALLFSKVSVVVNQVNDNGQWPISDLMA